MFLLQYHTCRAEHSNQERLKRGPHKPEVNQEFARLKDAVAAVPSRTIGYINWPNLKATGVAYCVSDGKVKRYTRTT